MSLACNECRKPIRGRYTEHRSAAYHLECFQRKNGLICAHCGDLLGKQWHEFRAGKYHLDCLEKSILEKCDVCGRGLTGSILQDPWGSKSHAHHAEICTSCSRILSPKQSAGAYVYQDGRRVCGHCKKTAIMDAIAAQQCKNRILIKLKEMGFGGIPPQTPVNLVDRKSLHKQGAVHQGQTKGLTVSTRRTRNGKVISRDHAVYILYGLPKLEFEAVLAHELVHVWQNEHDVRLKSSFSEGLCNLAAEMVYQNDASEMGRFFLNNLIKNPDPIYGAGYRKMKSYVQRTGWKALLHELMTCKGLEEISLWRKLFR